jgi:antitoxin VapB
VLEPVPDSWEWLDALAGALDADFVSAVREQPEATDRKPISNGCHA